MTEIEILNEIVKSVNWTMSCENLSEDGAFEQMKIRDNAKLLIEMLTK